jgi:hypothetical protein
MRALDLMGQRYNMLTVIGVAPIERGRRRWNVRCDCGQEKSISTSDLRGGRVVSCGCHKNHNTALRNKQNAKHGMTGSPTYITWFDMRQRCSYEKDKYFHLYGGRGVKVCSEWENFEAFLRDMGPRPDGKTLDRIDPELGYFKENCRWATPKEQAANKRKKKCAL